MKCPPLLEDELLVSIGQKYNKSTAQVALRFNVQRGVVVIPKSFNPERIKHNFQVGLPKCFLSYYGMYTTYCTWLLSIRISYGAKIPILCSIDSIISIKTNHILFQIFDFSLTEEEMKAIETLNKNIRFVELLM